jgi:hypothetical protein
MGERNEAPPWREVVRKILSANSAGANHGVILEKYLRFKFLLQATFGGLDLSGPCNVRIYSACGALSRLLMAVAIPTTAATAIG